MATLLLAGPILLTIATVGSAIAFMASALLLLMGLLEDEED